MTDHNSMVVIIGSTKTWEVEIGDERAIMEDLSLADRCTMRISSDITDPASVIADFSSTAGNMTIDSVKSLLTVTPTALVADAFPAGVFIAACNVRFGDDDSWQQTDRFYVTFIHQGAPTV